MQRKAFHDTAFWLESLVVGAVAGFGAVVFRELIGVFHNLLFLGKFSFAYDSNAYTPAAPWGYWVILVPVAGALGVAFMVKTFAPEAKGHGVPEVMEAVYYQKGIIRPVVAVIKSLASALSIGSGGSVGREGPIVQIGSSFGSTLGQHLRLPSWQRITLVAAGAGGGIAATFNAPIGGILFAAELLLPEISDRTLIPVAISTAMATYIGRWLLGDHASFVVPGLETTHFQLTNPVILIACLGLGGMLGIVSTIFIRSIYAFEDFFENRVSKNYYVRHLLGMLVLGVIIEVLHSVWGHYYIEGVGYATIQDLLNGTLTVLPLLLLLIVLKIVATSLTLGSGGSGGIFSPSLFIGAAFGEAYGLLLKLAFPHLPINPPAFAMVGMAGVVGSATGAAITAIVMIFEMTLDYQMILPMTVTVAISYGIRIFLLKESIYTLKLVRRGQPVPVSLHANSWQIRQARDFMDTRVTTIPVSVTLHTLEQAVSTPDRPDWLIVEELGAPAGVIEAAGLAQLLKQGAEFSLDDVICRNVRIVDERTTFFEILEQIQVCRPDFFLLASNNTDSVPPRSIKGVISKKKITGTLIDAIVSSTESLQVISKPHACHSEAAGRRI